MDDGTWGFRTTLERLDTETPTPPPCPPEAILSVLKVLHKNLSSSFDLLSLGYKMGLVDFCLKKRYSSEAKPRCCLSVCHLFYLYALFLTDMPLLPHANIFPSYRENKAPTPPALLNKSNASQGHLIETLCDLWTEQIGQRAWLSANTASNGELESESSIDLPVTFTQLA